MQGRQRGLFPCLRPSFRVQAYLERSTGDEWLGPHGFTTTSLKRLTTRLTRQLQFTIYGRPMRYYDSRVRILIFDLGSSINNGN